MSINERFVRWQGIIINQLGFTTNLILSINIAVIVFFANIKFSNSGLKLRSLFSYVIPCDVFKGI